MAIQNQIYKNPSKKNSYITVVVSGCKSPILPIKFSNLIRPFYYPNSPTIPRYSLATSFHPKKHETFLRTIQTIEQNENVDSIIKVESIKEGDGYRETGNLLIKFQTKVLIPVFMVGEGKSDDEGEEMVLEDELARGEMVKVVYDVLRYTKKNTEPTSFGISFKPVKVLYYPHLSQVEKGADNGDS
jgi:hypothetical protein